LDPGSISPRVSYILGIAFPINTYPEFSNIDNNPPIQNWKYPKYTQNTISPYFRFDVSSTYGTLNTNLGNLASGIVTPTAWGKIQTDNIFNLGLSKPNYPWRIMIPSSPFRVPPLLTMASINSVGYVTDVYVSSFKQQQLNHISTSNLSTRYR
jgi:hypothetical protein